MKKQIVALPGATSLPYSTAVRAGDFIFVSGQVGNKDERGNEIKDFEGQFSQCLENTRKILMAAGSSLEDVVKVTCFLGDVGNFPTMNEIYKSYFPKEPPARSTAITGLVNNSMLVEVESVAYHPEKK